MTLDHLLKPLELPILEPFMPFWALAWLRPRWASTWSGVIWHFNALSRSSKACFWMFDVFCKRYINSYSSFSSSETFYSISIRLLFSSRMLLISRFRCCIFFSRISCTKHKSDYSFAVHLPGLFGRSRPSSASVSFPWSTHFSSSPLPFASESLSYSSDSQPSRYLHHSTASFISFDSIN